MQLSHFTSYLKKTYIRAYYRIFNNFVLCDLLQPLNSSKFINSTVVALVYE